MPDRPLLILPAPERGDPPPAGRNISNLRVPPRGRQTGRFGPTFTRLSNALGRGAGMELRDDPTSLAPDRVIVFEIAGTVADFLKTIARVDGLEFMAEYDGEFAADEDFAERDTRKGKEGHDRMDKSVSGRYYLAMPDVRALRELVRLWERWQAGQPLDRGYAPFKQVFAQLRDLRPWGPQDRIPEETIAYWQEESQRNPDQPVRTEVELWFHNTEAKRQTVSRSFGETVTAVGGRIAHEVVIPEIAYHGALIDIPAGEVQNLVAHPRCEACARFDDVMFSQTPEHASRSSLQIESEAGEVNGAGVRPQEGTQPIAALFDGVPVQAQCASGTDGSSPDDPDGRLAGRAPRWRAPRPRNGNGVTHPARRPKPGRSAAFKTSLCTAAADD